jgi:hypothetical protein
MEQQPFVGVQQASVSAIERSLLGRCIRGGLLGISDQEGPSEEGQECGPAARNEVRQEEAKNALAAANGLEVEL